MCGANSGDWPADLLPSVTSRGSCPWRYLFAVIRAEKIVAWNTVAFCWVAIIVLRTPATNLADLGGHDLHLSYPIFFGALAALIGPRSRGRSLFRIATPKRHKQPLRVSQQLLHRTRDSSHPSSGRHDGRTTASWIHSSTGMRRSERRTTQFCPKAGTANRDRYEKLYRSHSETRSCRVPVLTCIA
jgi:hypothetical protein